MRALTFKHTLHSTSHIVQFSPGSIEVQPPSYLLFTYPSINMENTLDGNRKRCDIDGFVQVPQSVLFQPHPCIQTLTAVYLLDWKISSSWFSRTSTPISSFAQWNAMTIPLVDGLCLMASLIDLFRLAASSRLMAGGISHRWNIVDSLPLSFCMTDCKEIRVIYVCPDLLIFVMLVLAQVLWSLVNSSNLIPYYIIYTQFATIL